MSATRPWNCVVQRTKPSDLNRDPRAANRRGRRPSTAKLPLARLPIDPETFQYSMQCTISINRIWAKKMIPNLISMSNNTSIQVCLSWNPSCVKRGVDCKFLTHAAASGLTVTVPTRPCMANPSCVCLSARRLLVIVLPYSRPCIAW